MLCPASPEKCLAIIHNEHVSQSFQLICSIKPDNGDNGYSDYFVPGDITNPDFFFFFFFFFFFHRLVRPNYV